MYSKSYSNFSLNPLNAFSTKVVISKIGAKNAKLGKLDVFRRWGDLTRKMLRKKD